MNGAAGRLRRLVVRVVDLASRLLFVLLLSFVLFRVLPGDPVRAMTRGRPTTAERMAALRHEYGLDRPLPAQFVDYLGRAVRGDLGTSYAYHRPVAHLIGDRLGPTLLLLGTATLLSVLLGAGSGTLAGWRPGGRFDRWATPAALTLWATPTFWLGLVLMVVIGAGAGPLPDLLPVAGMRSARPAPGWLAGVLDVGRHLILPCLTLVAVQYGQYHLLMRSSLAGERAAPYVVLARAKGLRDAAVRRRHAVPNALLPTATLALINTGFVVSGSVAVETVFSWPGLGYLAYEALQVPDLPVLHGTFLVFAVAVIAANAAADALHARIDPRTDLRSPLTP